jgi:hypothetical protein
MSTHSAIGTAGSPDRATCRRLVSSRARERLWPGVKAHRILGFDEVQQELGSALVPSYGVERPV